MKEDNVESVLHLDAEIMVEEIYINNVCVERKFFRDGVLFREEKYNMSRTPRVKFMPYKEAAKKFQYPGKVSWRPTLWMRFKKWAFGIDWMIPLNGVTLHPYQQKIIDEMSKPGRMTLMMPRNAGKNTMRRALEKGYPQQNDVN